MSYSLSNKKFNHSVHEYLLNSDLINKYNLRNIYKKPKLKKVVIHFPINNLLQSNSFGSNLQIKSFLIFHVLFFTSSFINFDTIKINKYSNSVVNPEYSLKIVLSSQEDINLLLLNLLVENFSQFEKESLTTKTSTNFVLKPINTFCHNLSIPGKFFFDADNFFSSVIKDSNFKELDIKCSFIFENLKGCKNISNAIKNVSPLWVGN